MDNDNKKLYIPFDLNFKNELREGFGKEQMPEFLVGVCISLVFSVISSVIWHFIIGVGLFVFGVFVTVFLVNKQRLINLSVVDQIKIIIRHKREQQKFEYKYKDDFFGKV